MLTAGMDRLRRTRYRLLKPTDKTRPMIPEPEEHPVFLSIVINNYNYEHFVGDAIESALAAADEGTEIIVVDDGSSDRSVEVISGYANVRLVEKENGGQASALNIGAAEARGEYILFLDADDLLTSEAVAIIRRTAPGHDLIWYAIEVLWDGLGRVSYYPSSRRPPEPNLWAEYMGKGTAWLRPTSCNVFSAKLAQEVFPLPEENWRVCADHIALTLAAQHASYQGCGEVINLYRFHGANLYFSNTLSTIEPHIYKDRYVPKNSSNYRHFYYVAAAESLMRIEDAERYAAVLSHWITIGEVLRAEADLTEPHAEVVDAVSAALLRTQPAQFWDAASEALLGLKIDPRHLSAFHEAPGVLPPEVVAEDWPPLPFNEGIGVQDLIPHLEGGFDTWDEAAREPVYSLSQACRFTARMNPMADHIRAMFGIADGSLGGAVRLVGPDGRFVETVYDPANATLLADIPCDWVSEGCLRFYFVFETVQIPQASELSSCDTGVTGAYVRWARFNAPLANLFYRPVPVDTAVPAARYLSPLKHILSDSPLIEPDHVLLSQKTTHIGVSVPFTDPAETWLTVELENRMASPAALAIETDFFATSAYTEIRDQIILSPGTHQLLRIPVGFEVFSESQPVVSFRALGHPSPCDALRLCSLRFGPRPLNEIDLPALGGLSLTDGSLASAALDPEAWQWGGDGVLPRGKGPAAFTLHLGAAPPEELVFWFAGPDPRDERIIPKQLYIAINGATQIVPLSREGAARVKTGGGDAMTVEGWFTDSPPYAAPFFLITRQS